jgi:hypothetical protein
MRKRTWILLMVSALLIPVAVRGVVGPGGRTAVTIATVIYAPYLVGPVRREIVGEWVTDCDGNTTGWGWHPGDSFTETEWTDGALCPPPPPPPI